MAMSVKDGMGGVAVPPEGDGSKNDDARWDGRCHDPGLEMFKAAYRLAIAMGLSNDQMPELRTENGVLHAYRPNGSKMRLSPCLGWEEESGYADLLRELSGRRANCR